VDNSAEKKIPQIGTAICVCPEEAMYITPLLMRAYSFRNTTECIDGFETIRLSGRVYNHCSRSIVDSAHWYYPLSLFIKNFRILDGK
jgi:hypothetical protein